MENILKHVPAVKHHSFYPMFNLLGKNIPCFPAEVLIWFWVIGH